MIFKKPKHFEVRQEVLNAIHFHAEKNMDGLYNPDFEENDQCGGYYAFKNLVLQPEPLPKTHEFPKDYSITGGSEPGMYLLSRLHVLIRERALKCADEIRKTFKIR